MMYMLQPDSQFQAGFEAGCSWSSFPVALCTFFIFVYQFLHLVIRFTGLSCRLPRNYTYTLHTIFWVSACTVHVLGNSTLSFVNKQEHIRVRASNSTPLLPGRNPPGLLKIEQVLCKTSSTYSVLHYNNFHCIQSAHSWLEQFCPVYMYMCWIPPGIQCSVAVGGSYPYALLKQGRQLFNDECIGWNKLASVHPAGFISVNKLASFHCESGRPISKQASRLWNRLGSESGRNNLEFRLHVYAKQSWTVLFPVQAIG